LLFVRDRRATEQKAMIARHSLVLLVATAIVCSTAGLALAQPDATEPGPLKVGLATVNITPEGPVYMAGFAARKEPSEGAYADIHASCVVFDNAVTRVGLMAIDVCKIGIPQMEQIRAAGQQLGIPPQHIMINSSHTHCGPTIIGNKNPDYLPVFEEKVCGLLQKAVDDLQEARLDYTVGSCTMAVNRRQLNEEGKCIGMRCEPRKPIDPDVPVLRVLTPEGTVRAVIFGYACHPTAMGGQLIGPDYVGAAREWIAAGYPGCLPIFLQGCAGDIKCRTCKPPNGRFGYVLIEAEDTVRELGHELGRAVITALAVPPQPLPADGSGKVVLGGITELVKVPDKEDPENKSHEIYNGAWRIGDLHLFGSQCEVCVQIGLRIKRELSDLRVWTNAYTHWGGGYIVDAAQFPEGGYEVKSSVCAPETEDIVVGNAVRFIRELQTNPVYDSPIPEPED
jgi:hypothetical protein